MIFQVDLGGTRPLFEQVAAGVRAEIVMGRLREGDRLPAARDVAEALDINVHTVLRAYQDLRDEGLIDLRRGRGAVVTAAAAPLAALHDDLRSLAERAAALGVPASTLASLLNTADPARDNRPPAVEQPSGPTKIHAPHAPSEIPPSEESDDV